jgi:hypothetical protein
MKKGKTLKDPKIAFLIGSSPFFLCAAVVPFQYTKNIGMLITIPVIIGIVSGSFYAFLTARGVFDERK